MLQTRARTTHEDRGHARATQQTHARACARVHKEPNAAHASARGSKQCPREGAQETKPWARKRATQQRRARARTAHGELVCARGDLMSAYLPVRWACVSLFAREVYLCANVEERPRARARLCVRAPCSRASSFLLARHLRAPLVARAPRARTSFCSRARTCLPTCPKMLARSRCASRGCRGSTYELICFEWS